MFRDSVHTFQKKFKEKFYMCLQNYNLYEFSYLVVPLPTFVDLQI